MNQDLTRKDISSKISVANLVFSCSAITITNTIKYEKLQEREKEDKKFVYMVDWKIRKENKRKRRTLIVHLMPSWMVFLGINLYQCKSRKRGQ